jgi:hypothetical protein
MKVIRKSIIKKPLDVYDISVENDKHYILDNGIISHNTMDMYSGPVVSGGGGPAYAADVTITLTKAKSKEGTEHIGAILSLTVQKSRYMPEGVKGKVVLLFKKGLQKHSYLLEMGRECGIIDKEGISYILDGVKKKRTDIIKDPESFFTPSALEILRVAIKNKWSFGEGDGEIDLTNEGEEIDLTPEEE